MHVAALGQRHVVHGLAVADEMQDLIKNSVISSTSVITIIFNIISITISIPSMLIIKRIIIIIIIIMMFITIIMTLAPGAGPRSASQGSILSSGMWCLRMWCLIIIYLALSLTYILPDMGPQNYYYQTPHPQTPHP